MCPILYLIGRYHSDDQTKIPSFTIFSYAIKQRRQITSSLLTV